MLPTSGVMAITGGASGIGLATAKLWVEMGGNVVLLDVSNAALDVAVAELGSAARGVLTDVTHAVSVNEAVASIANQEQRLDALVCCAGNSLPVPTASMTDEEFEEVINVHLSGTVRACRAAYPLLKETSRVGSIVTLSSVAGQLGMPQRASYNSAKHGLIGLTRSLAVEWASDGIRTNAVAPGYVWTTLNVNLESQGLINKTEITNRVPMQRWGEPAEIAQAIVFLSSPWDSYINGHTLYVDGGMTVDGDWYGAKNDF